MVVDLVRRGAEIHDLTGSGSSWKLSFPLEFVVGALVIGRLCRLRLRLAPALEPAI